MQNAVILAGGRGKRMGLRTWTSPKSMQPVNGKPILAYHLGDLRDAGVTDVSISEGYRGRKIRNYFGDGSDMGISITHLDHGLAMPTSQKARRALELIHGNTPEGIPVFVSNGDIITAGPEHLKKLLADHKETGAKVTMDLVTHTPPYGVVDLDDDRNVVSFRERPPLKIYSGISVVDSSIYTSLPDEGSFIEEVQNAFPDATKGYFDAEAAQGWLHLTYGRELRTASRELRGRRERE